MTDLPQEGDGIALRRWMVHAGNFWGVSRNRCTIIKAEQIEEMIQRGMVKREGQALRVIVG